jgi:hypothetical protein
LFRAWIVTSVVWILLAGTVGFVLIRDELGLSRFQYVPEMRESVDLSKKVDWSRPYYELVFSPSEISTPPYFDPVGFEYVASWDEYVSEMSQRGRCHERASALLW